MKQQDWSRMERLGSIPFDAQLEIVCRALGCPLSAAFEVINIARTINAKVAEYQAQYVTYTRRAIERDREASGQIGVFVIRDDPEPVDYVAVREYVSFLAATKNTMLVWLFRLPDPRIWRSFCQLAGTIAQQLDAESVSRMRAFYRHPEYAEQSEASLPMLHPYLLTCSNRGPELASAVFDDQVKQQEMTRGCDEAVAAQNSLCIITHDRHRAAQITNWVGLSSAIDPLPQLWVPITAAT